MISNMLRVTFRNMMRQRGYAFINVAGLALGLASAILIGLFVRLELSFDRFHEQAEGIYRVVMHIHRAEEMSMAMTPAPMGEELANTMPEVQAYTVINPVQDMLLTRGTDAFSIESAFRVNDGFFDVFNFPTLEGDAAVAINQPSNILLTESAVTRIFGRSDVVGEQIDFSDQSYTVGAVLADPPANSHIQFEALIPAIKLPESMRGMWMSFGGSTYLKLAPDTKLSELESKIDALVQEKLPMTGEGGKPLFSFELQPMLDIHLKSNLPGDPANNGSYAAVKGFSVIAIIILLLACINFINLATARSTQRAREVGMRKVLGAQRNQLIRQFLGESVFYAFLGIVIAIAIVQMVLPLFSNLANRQMEFAPFNDPLLGAGLLLILLVVGFVSGSFPAFYLSAFQPTSVLKGTTRKGTGGAKLRQGLVVAQFFVAIALIISTITIYRQVQYLQTKRLGFDSENVVMFRIPQSAQGVLTEATKNEVLEIAGVQSATISRGTPLGGTSNRLIVEPQGDADNDEPLSLESWAMEVDPDYVKTFGLEIVEGRDFDPDIMTDYTSSLLLNEAAVRALGWEGKALGQQIPMPRREGLVSDTEEEGGSHVKVRMMENVDNNVIGVLRDYNYSALYNEIEPLILYVETNYADELTVRVAPGEIPATVKRVQALLEQKAPGMPIEPRFMNDRVNATYRGEIRFASMITSFATLAVVIAALGLFGLASFTTEARTKEIGIRKVLGSSVLGVMLLLTREFTRPVLIAALLAVPASWYLLHRWLENFAFHVDHGISLPLLALLSALLLGWISVGFQAWRAAYSNPVKALRYE